MEGKKKKAAAPRINFTKKAILAIRPPRSADPAKPAARLVYWDTHAKGLCLRISETGTITFSVHRRVKNTGATSTVTIGRFPDVTIEMARTEAAKLGGEYATGIDPAKKRQSTRRELTLEGAFKEYLEYMKGQGKMRRPEKKEDLYRLYLSHWRKRKLGNIESSEVADWFRALPAKIIKLREQIRSERERKAKAQGRTIAPTDSPNPQQVTGRPTANQALKLLRVVYQTVINDLELYVGRVPGAKIAFYRERPRKRFIQKGEMPAFFKAMFTEENTDVRDYVFVSLLTGGRRSNVMSMEWGELTLVHGQGAWFIPKEKSKTEEDLNLPLINEAVALLQDRRDLFDSVASTPVDIPTKGGKRAQEHYQAELRMRERQAKYVFPGIGKHGHMVEPKKVWHEILKRAGLQNLRLHDLRRTLASWQIKMGSELRVIQDSLAHQSLDATLVYTYLELDPVRESVAKATAAMFAAAQPEDAGAEVIPIKVAA